MLLKRMLMSVACFRTRWRNRSARFAWPALSRQPRVAAHSARVSAQNPRQHHPYARQLRQPIMAPTYERQKSRMMSFLLSTFTFAMMLCTCFFTVLSAKCMLDAICELSLPIKIIRKISPSRAERLYFAQYEGSKLSMFLIERSVEGSGALLKCTLIVRHASMLSIIASQMNSIFSAMLRSAKNQNGAIDFSKS